MTAAPGLVSIQQRIRAACENVGRNPDTVNLIAVTKTQTPSVLAELTAGGVFDFGENRVDHLHTMIDERPAGGRFHYIGRVQSRQFTDIVQHCDTLHSLADVSHVPKLAKVCAKLNRRLGVFVQVNTAEEDNKAGVSTKELPRMLDTLKSHSQQIELLGLMAMAPNAQLDHYTQNDVEACFKKASALAQKYQLQRLSMGMSQDFELAIAAGATDLRIGSILFQPQAC